MSLILNYLCAWYIYCICLLNFVNKLCTIILKNDFMEILRLL